MLSVSLIRRAGPLHGVPLLRRLYAHRVRVHYYMVVDGSIRLLARWERIAYLGL